MGTKNETPTMAVPSEGEEGSIQMDDYEEGEEQCVIKVEIISAQNVWAAEPVELKSKAGFTIKFPGGEPEDAPPEIEGVLPDVMEDIGAGPVAPGGPPAKEPPLAEATTTNGPPPQGAPTKGAPAQGALAKGTGPEGKKGAPTKGAVPEEATGKGASTEGTESGSPPPPPPPPVSFSMGPLVREFDRVPEYTLWHKFLHEPMIATLYWISPSGASKTILATARVDLTGVLDLNGNSMEGTYALEAYVDQTPPPPLAKKGGKSAPPPKKDEKGKKGDEKGKKVAPAAPVEVIPVLLPGATMKVRISTSIPLLSDIDRKDGFVMELDVVAVRSLPPKVKEFGTPGNVDPFSYTVGLKIPGLSGAWWDSLTCFEETEKANLSVLKAVASTIEMEEVTFPKPFEPPEDKGAGPRELKTLLFGESDGSESKEVDIPQSFAHGMGTPDEFEVGTPTPEPEMITEMHAVIKWKATVRRYLPSEGADKLRERIKKGGKFEGELSRYLKQERIDDLFDPHFERYHSSFQMNLITFLDQEGLKESTISCPLGDFNGGPPLCPPDDRPPGKKAKAVEDEGGPPPAVVQGKDTKTKETDPAPVVVKRKDTIAKVVDTAPLPNAWKAAQSQIFIIIKTSLPLEPIWYPPPEPELKLEDIIPPRPKAPTVYDTVKIATEKFKEFVQIAAHDISNLHQRVVGGEKFEEPQLGAESLLTKSRIDSKADIRKTVVHELHRSGAWQLMRDEMKSRVLKIASEKFKLGKKDAISSGKFDFCNSLYVKLMEEIHACLADLFLKRHRSTMPFGKEDKPLSEREQKLQHLRQLADEYEYDGDYRSANKFHQDRLLGESIHDADIWFEYGCFCMRVKDTGRPKDRGKAEECFREAITLDKNHFLSLLALACLMWHRGFLTQTEVLLHSAIELHPEEEFIPWCILSQIHQAQAQREYVRNCLKKAELLYKSAKASRNSYTAPHILLSNLIKFPFSAAYLVLRGHDPSTVFIDTALLLLDLHLPKEAKQILELECDVFSTVLDNKWAQAKSHELMMEYKRGEVWLKENLALFKEDAMAWLLMGRNRYVSGQFEAAIEAYEKHFRYQDKNDIYSYVYLDMGNSHLQRKNYMAAKQIFLKLCSIGPTTSSWLGAGIAFFRMGDFKHAEIALVEGNHIDSKNQKVWAYLALTCLAMDRSDEAEIAFQQMQKTELTNVPLLLEIADAFAKLGNYRDAEAAVMEALKEDEGRVSARFKLAELYLHQGKIECSKIEYEKILGLDDVSPKDQDLAASKLCEVQALAFFANEPSSDRRVTI